MDFFENIKQNFKQGNALTRLIYINIGVFIALQVVIILLQLFNISGSFLVSKLAIPADVIKILHRPWSIITYMFVHERFFHILFNMFALYWFGKLFLIYFSEKQLIALYLLGGLFGALLYIISFNLFPYFSTIVHITTMIGASASIMAIIVAIAMQSPNMEMGILFIGNVKLKYIAIVAVLMSFFGITSNNAGGELAHLGGALYGYLFIVSLRQGIDITKWLNNILDFIYSIFNKPKLKVKKNYYNTKPKMTDAEYNITKAQKMKEIDKILDKIKTSGYESLSMEEKKRLFEQGKN